MKPLIEQHNVRYPPFEAARWEPNALPVASRNFVIGHYETATEAVKGVLRVPLRLPLPIRNDLSQSSVRQQAMRQVPNGRLQTVGSARCAVR